MHRRILIFLLVVAGYIPAIAQEQPNDSIVKPHPWQALGGVIVVNGIIHGFNRYVKNEPFAQTTLNSIKDNFHSKWIWDNDKFYMNELGHPYQGGLYFNAARSKGLSFVQSIPYTIVGSLMWEYLGETEPPSINDVLTTSFSGPLLGEVTHRMSLFLIDESERGIRRFAREAAAALVNPVGGFNRLVSGRMWKVRSDGHPMRQTDDDYFALSIGDRYVADASRSSDGAHQFYINFDMEYGKLADDEPHHTPFDYFSIDGTFAFGKKQHYMVDLSINGRICSTPLMNGRHVKGDIGLFQFFQFEDTHLQGEPRGVFPYSEVVSLGPALTLAFPTIAPHLSTRHFVAPRAIGLGTTESDYYDVYNRQYNMGCGYGISSNNKITWKDVMELQLDANYMHLYTWKGYEPDELSNTSQNAMGDYSNTHLLKLSTKVRATICHPWKIVFSASYYRRSTNYRYYSSHITDSYELRGGIEWHL